MPDKQSPKESRADEWEHRAHDDELNARSILTHRDGTPNGVCFLAHQMAEKYLKAYLVAEQKQFPRTHNLGALAELCEKSDSAFAELRHDTALLDPFYTPARYPSDYPEFTWEDAELAFALGQKIRTFVREKLIALSYSPENDGGFGSLGFLVVVGVALALFATLIIARPWSTTTQPEETIGEPKSTTDATNPYDRLCELTGGTPTYCPENAPPNAGMCLQCICPEGTSWQPAHGGCMHDAESSPPDSTIQPPDANTSSSIDTSDWKTYRNEEYEFEVRYPREYNPMVNDRGDIVFVGGYFPCGHHECLPKDIVLVPKAEPQFLSNGLVLPEEIVAQEIFFKTKINPYPAQHNAFVGTIAIDNRTGYQITHSEFGTRKVTLIKNPDQRNWFLIESYYETQNPYSTALEPYDTILSTLKFIE